MSDIFVSYAEEDSGFARTLANVLEKQGWTVWWDRKIPPGRSFDEVISEALSAARCVIVLWSKSSVQSGWVKEEATEAARRGILVPATIEEAEIPLGFRRIQTARLTGWKGQSAHAEFKRLLDSVANIVGEEPPVRLAATAIPRVPVAEATSPVNHHPAGLTPKRRTAAAVIAFLLVSVVGNLIGGYIVGWLLVEVFGASPSLVKVIFYVLSILILILAFFVGKKVWQGGANT